MAHSAEYIRYVEDLFSVLPGSTVKRMFGGAGVFREGLMYGLATSEGGIALKADEQTVPAMQAGGATEWVYERDGNERRMGYWYVPESLLDEPDEFRQWAETAFETARRADAKKSPRQRKWTGAG